MLSMSRRASRPGTAARSLGLLGLMWRPSQPLGRTGVRVAAITEAATAVADAEGLDAVTMRRVAEHVGVGTMTLYGHVPGRGELVELMLDRWAAGCYDGHPLPAALRRASDPGRDDWRAAVEHVVLRNWAHTLAHPWVVEVPPDRPILGPGVSTKYDRELAAVDGIGLADVEMDHLLTAVLGMVSSAARWQIGLERVRRASGLSDEQWWALSGPALAEAMAGVELPLGSRVGQSVGSAGDPEKTLRWGLVRLLDGVESGLRRG
jgi:AcrR family transcriptional regulator